MEFFPAGKHPAKPANPEWFTGTVWMERITEKPEQTRPRSERVQFEPGARSAWHSHPLGETVHVITGLGLIGRRGVPPQLMQPGDTVLIQPGEEHWHGATPDMPVEHIAVQEAECGFVTTWVEHVSDEDYLPVTEASFPFET